VGRSRSPATSWRPTSWPRWRAWTRAAWRRLARRASPQGHQQPRRRLAKKEPKKALAAEALAKLEAKLAGKSGFAGVVQLRVKDPDGVWSVDLGANPPSVTQGERSDAGATITLGDAQLAALVNGESKMQELFQKGALTIDGNITLARQLEQATGASK
jgi:alkyl sulfatase BDS1-like metallo-beta-lactamase superfamily hydrolase